MPEAVAAARSRRWEGWDRAAPIWLLAAAGLGGVGPRGADLAARGGGPGRVDPAAPGLARVHERAQRRRLHPRPLRARARRPAAPEGPLEHGGARPLGR